mmetsp:Transcript_143403/g.357291  ORF Transcript_143403/g.357291 Transcript_143403/m.357291 type:complete len:83 (-) Transcript_143403:1219-1467(-)
MGPCSAGQSPADALSVKILRWRRCAGQKYPTDTNQGVQNREILRFKDPKQSLNLLPALTRLVHHALRQGLGEIMVMTVPKAQ